MPVLHQCQYGILQIGGAELFETGPAVLGATGGKAPHHIFVALVRYSVDNCGPGSILHGAGEQEAAGGPDDRRWPTQDGLWDGGPARIIQRDFPGDARDSSIDAFGIRQQLHAHVRVRPVSTDQEVSVCGSAIGETRDDRAARTIHERLEFPSEADDVIHAV